MNIQNRVKGMSVAVLLGIVSILSYSTMTASPVHAACSPGSGSLPTTVFVPWYNYLDCDSSGAPQITSWEEAVPLIGMAILDMLTRIAGLVAIGFIVWGGIQYTLSQGEPEGMKNARSTIMNAIVGLVISLLAIGIIQFIAGLLQ